MGREQDKVQKEATEELIVGAGPTQNNIVQDLIGDMMGMEWNAQEAKLTNNEHLKKH